MPSNFCTASECDGDDNCEQVEDATTNAKGSANGDHDVDVEKYQTAERV